jgi:glycosyltransferase involved in cell wall biosynthesis
VEELDMTGSFLAGEGTPQRRLCRIVCSSEQHDDIADQLGIRHYSYGFVERKFFAVLQSMGFAPERIELPAYYGGRGLKETEAPSETPAIHLMFRSPENLQPIRGCYNIACFAWEFEILKDQTMPFEHPFLNQARMLGLCQEIWVPAHFTREVMLKYGFTNVHYMPAPIEVPDDEAGRSERIAKLRSLVRVPSLPLRLTTMPHWDGMEGPLRSEILPLAHRPCLLEAINSNRLFMTVFNPHDRRKNAQELILGFMTLLDQFPDAALLIKLILPSKWAAPEQIPTYMRGIFDQATTISCDRIVITSQYLSDVEMSAMYAASDFYLCTSVAEGQNLPLLEAMAHGVVPVTPNHTAMSDYISERNSVIVPMRRVAAYRHELAGDAAAKPYSVDFASQTDIGKALLRACRMPLSQRDALSENARDTAARLFSPSTVAALLRDRLATISRASGTRDAVRAVVSG